MIMKQTASAAATPPFNASSLIRDTEVLCYVRHFSG